jgi:copper chaperone CopZ
MVIQMDLGDLPGVTSAAADHRTGITEVVYDDSLVTPEQIVAVITKAGYGAEPVAD